MTQSSRRHFFKTSVVGVAAVASSQSIAQTPSLSKLSKQTIADVEALNARDHTSCGPCSDGGSQPF